MPSMSNGLDAAQLGREVMRLRRMKGWKQTQLAVIAQCNVSTISRLERGEHVPTVTTLAAVATALDVPVSALFTGAAA